MIYGPAALDSRRMEPEHTRDFTGNTGVLKKSAAESGAAGAENGLVDPDLAAVVQAWPDLPAATRRQMVAMVEAVAGDE